MDFADAVVGKVHRLQLPIPIDITDDLAEVVAGAGYSTLVRLPLRDRVAAARAREEMRLLRDEKASIVLFLERLESLVLETVDADSRRILHWLVSLVGEQTRTSAVAGKSVSVRVDSGGRRLN